MRNLSLEISIILKNINTQRLFFHPQVQAVHRIYCRYLRVNPLITFVFPFVHRSLT